MTALNMYGGSLTLISAIDSFKQVRPTLTVRVVDDRLHRRALARRSRCWPRDNFLANFENFLLLVLYFFIPWTAVNLVDYYIVRRGHYAIAEIFKPDGIYGRWGWRGIVVLPGRLRGDDAVLQLGTLHRLVANAADGADISLFIGLPVAGDPLLVLSPLDRRRGRDGGWPRPSRPSSSGGAAHELP